ncbi:nucleoporin nup189 [Coprinopsis cinerea AmutBmut pab1-1]|nr:nucleoporin nup189 [Coprinopsis cinerea AmutBmut pab1-1]
MARFRAYASDSSSSDDDEPEVKSTTSQKPPSKHYEEESESEPEESEQDEDDEDDDEEESDESSEESESSSGLSDDEIIYGRSRRRPRTALVEDENGDIQLTGSEDVDIRVSSASSSRSSATPEPRGINGDPNIIPWARQIGVDAQKMHVMQTSLFRMPEEAAALKALSQPQTRHKTLNLQPSTLSLNRKHSRDSEGDGLRHDSRERASFAHDLDQSMFRPSRKYTRVEIASSIAKGKEGDYADAGLAFGRSFRAGWGPGGTVVHVGAISGLSGSSPPDSPSTLTFTRTPFPPVKTQSPETSPPAIALKLLQHHLSATPIETDEFKIPAARPKQHDPRLQFASFAALFPTTDALDPAPLFRLGSALFDPIDLKLNSKGKNGSTLPGATLITPDVRNRIILLRRRTALSKWLETVVSPAVEGDIRTRVNGAITGSPYSPADTVYTQLTGHQVSQACATAMDAGYLKLATLISQAGGDEIFRADIQEQLAIWREEKLAPTNTPPLPGTPPALLSKGIWKVYQLLGGPPLDNNDAALSSWVEDVCAGLDWKRVLGLCIWYGTSIDTSVAEVVRLYEGLVRRYSQTIIARPLPKWQLERNSNPPSSTAPSFSAFGSRAPLALIGASPHTPGNKQQAEDPLYSLIRLHADPALSLSQILDPRSFGPDERWGGIGMCWHLYMILSRVMRIRDFTDRTNPTSARANGRADSADAVEDIPSDGHSPTADLLTSSYAFQLESWDMIQEAAFVLLHLENPQGREKALKDLIARSAPKMDDWTTRGLQGSLKIPGTWVEEAKAMYALDQGDVFKAYELYLRAQLYNSAHELAVLELAPDAILRRDLDLLRNLFEPFDLEGRRDKIDGWFVRGKVFLDYVNIMTRVPILQDQVESERNEQGLDTTIPDAAVADELDELTRKIPKLIALLPDVLYRNRNVDDRHAAAIEEMTQGLLHVMGKAKPSMLLKQPILGFMDGATKISLIRGKGYARFLQGVAA